MNNSENAEYPVFLTRHFKIRGPEGILMDALMDCPEKGPENAPLLIILHGLTGYKEEAQLAALAKAASENGFYALRPDLYGHGACGGSFLDHSVLKWMDQITSLIRQAKETGRYSKVYLCGHSQGALCTLLAAAAGKENVNGVIALAPALKIPQQAAEGTLFGLNFDPADVPDDVNVWGKALSDRYIRDAQAVLKEDLTAYKGPVLFVHSDTDEKVPVQVSKEAVKMFPNAQLRILRGDTHDFDLDPRIMADAVMSWLLNAEDDPL